MKKKARTYQVVIDFTKEEKEMVRRNADRYNFRSMSSYIRFVACNLKINRIYFGSDSNELKGGNQNEATK